MDRPLRTPLLLIGTAALCVLSGAALTGYSAVELGPEMMLRTSGKPVMATVTASRTMEGHRTGLSHELRYQFRHKGRKYTRSDATGRTNLWSTLPEGAWRRAVQAKKVTVLMLPQSPTHNRPAEAELPLGDLLAGLGMGLFLVLLGLAMGGGVLRERLQQSRMPRVPGA